MRKCLRCENEMVEDLVLMVSNGYEIDVREKGLFKTVKGKINCAVCPKCGYAELYLKNPEKIIFKEGANNVRN